MTRATLDRIYEKVIYNILFKSGKSSDKWSIASASFPGHENNVFKNLDAFCDDDILSLVTQSVEVAFSDAEMQDALNSTFKLPLGTLASVHKDHPEMSMPVALKESYSLREYNKLEGDVKLQRSTVTTEVNKLEANFRSASAPAASTSTSTVAALATQTSASTVAALATHRAALRTSTITPSRVASDSKEEEYKVFEHGR